MKYFFIFLILFSFTTYAYADDSLFEYEILPVHLESDNIELRNIFDWTSDGKILFRAELENDKETLVLVSVDGKVVKQLNLDSIDESSLPIIHAQIDPTDDNIIHFLKNNTLYRYLLDKDKITGLDTGGYKVGFFDYYNYSEDDSSKHMIAYSIEDPNNSEQYLLFSMNDSHEENLEQTISERMSNLENAIFQLSPDGKKILFKQTLTASYGQADRRISYLGAQDYGPHVVSDLNIRCGNYPKWYPPGELIVYNISYCGRGAPGGILGIVSMDGSRNQVLLPDNNDNPHGFAISDDGSSIAVLPYTDGKSYGEIADFYLLNLKSLSEKGTIFPRHGNPPDSFTPLQHERNGTPFDQMQCRNDNHLLIQKHDGSPACVKPESIPKLIERGWAKNNDHPFGIMGPIMNQESCNVHVISQWQPTFEGREMVQQFLKLCIQKGFTTPELVERGKIADNFTYGPIQTAKRSAQGDIEKTIEILEEMYLEKTIENLEEMDEKDLIKSVVHVGVDKEEYHTDDVVIISGYVEGIVPNTELNLTIRNPLMDMVLVSQPVLSEDGIFTEYLKIGGPLWSQNGLYSISAQYGKATNSTDFLYLSDLESDDLL